MSYFDLPRGWERHPVSDPRRAADVLDLFVSADLREAGAIYLLLCDDGDRVLQPCAVETMPTGSPQMRRQDFFAPFLQVLRGLATSGGVLVALARPDGLSISTSDLMWQSAAYDMCEASGARLLGVHLLTLHGSRVLPPRISRAA